MNNNWKTIYILAGMLVTFSVIFGLLKVTDVVEWDWLWVTSGLWVGLIIFVTVLVLGNSGDRHSKVKVKKEPPKPDKNEMIDKALDQIREKNKKLKLYEPGDTVQRAVNRLKKEKENRIDREAEKLNRLRGK